MLEHLFTDEVAAKTEPEPETIQVEIVDKDGKPQEPEDDVKDSWDAESSEEEGKFTYCAFALALVVHQRFVSKASWTHFLSHSVDQADVKEAPAESTKEDKKDVEAESSNEGSSDEESNSESEEESGDSEESGSEDDGKTDAERKREKALARIQVSANLWISNLFSLLQKFMFLVFP